ncbi:MAG: hypothetical protein PHD43_24440, partial [Methylococcales bacterium]|nr:hypothetical protein [Methylococcales bacterium]
GRAFRGFIAYLVILRTVLLTLAVLLAFLLASDAAFLFGLQEWLYIFKVYLLVVWLRVSGHFLFQLLESTLHQGLGQTAFVLATLTKLILFGWLIYAGMLGLESVIWMEVIAEAAGLFILVFGVVRVARQAQTESAKLALSEWWGANANRVTRYGFAGYIQHLAILPYGSSPNRLVAGRFLEVASIAAFGFAQSFMDMLKRYLPAQLLAGVIRPVLVARFATDRNFGAVEHMLSLVFRINTILLGLLAAVLMTVGPEFVAMVSKGKYGPESAWLLLSLIAVLALESRRYLVDLAIQTVERNGLLVVGNLALSASLILGVVGVPLIGAQAIPFAAVLCLAASNIWITHRLAHDGFLFPFGFPAFIRILMAVVLAAFVGGVVKVFLGWRISLFSICALYPLMLRITNAGVLNDLRMLRKMTQRDAIRCVDDFSQG